MISFSRQVSRFILDFDVHSEKARWRWRVCAGWILFVVSLCFEAFGKRQRLKKIYILFQLALFHAGSLSIKLSADLSQSCLLLTHSHQSSTYRETLVIFLSACLPGNYLAQTPPTHRYKTNAPWRQRVQVP
jgi:hypothetical protein